MDILRLGPNRPAHFYRGGPAIAAFRGIDDPDQSRPEDWIASVTSRVDDDAVGLTVLPDGGYLRDAVQGDPDGFLGPEHVAAFGADPALLVKLLNPEQRLPVHVHPDASFASRHLGCAHGKTEAWLVVDAAPDAVVHLGFEDNVTESMLHDWVSTQDVAKLLESMCRVPVRAGDAFLVPAGVPHAIGAGLLIVELQEPTDFSIFLEWQGFDIEADSERHLGLGLDLALDAVARAPRDIGALTTIAPAELPAVRRALPADADAYFRADVLCPAHEALDLDQDWSVLIVTAGAGRIDGADDSLAIHRGDVVLVPWAAGPAQLRGDVTAIRCRPPLPVAS